MPRTELHQLVQFAAIQPDAAAGGAVVDFHTLAVGHQQGGVGAYGAFHLGSPVRSGEHRHAGAKPSEAVAAREFPAPHMLVVSHAKRLIGTLEILVGK